MKKRQAANIARRQALAVMKSMIRNWMVDGCPVDGETPDRDAVKAEAWRIYNVISARFDDLKARTDRDEKLNRPTKL